MTKCVMVVSSGAVSGKEAEYADWYDNVHIKDIGSLTGVQPGRRLVAAPEISPNAPPGAQLALYEIETDDIGKVMEEWGSVLHRASTR